MSILNNDGVVFRDVAGGGWYCNTCMLPVHPDMIHSHKHTQGIDLTKKSPDGTRRQLESLKESSPNNHQSSQDKTLLDDWAPIFVNGVIPPEFREWCQRQWIGNVQPDSQAGDELERKELEYDLEELHRGDDGHTKHLMMVDLDILAKYINDYAERLAARRAVEELKRAASHNNSEYTSDYLEDRIATLTGGG